MLKMYWDLVSASNDEVMVRSPVEELTSNGVLSVSREYEIAALLPVSGSNAETLKIVDPIVAFSGTKIRNSGNWNSGAWSLESTTATVILV